MEHIEKSIENYLSKDTDYAFLITGAWGSGKTYFLKQEAEYLKEDYNFIFVSLYGINSLKEINSAIFLERYPWAKNKYLQATGSAIKPLLKNLDVDKLIALFSNEDTVSDSPSKQDSKLTDAVDWFKEQFNKKKEEKPEKRKKEVIVFDDLERKGRGLDFKEIVGYIDNQVNTGVKVVTLVNRDKIVDESFKEITEKTFGITVEYKPNLLKIINEIVAQQFGEILSIISQNQSIIEGAFLKNSNNLRILKFALSHFEDVHRALLDAKINDPEILQEILKFTLAIAIEYREGHITFADKKGIESSFYGNYDDLEHILNRHQRFDTKEIAPVVTKNDTYRANFAKKYFEDKNYDFFQSIYNYITGGYLNKNSLIEHANGKIAKRTQPYYKLYHKLTDSISYLLTLEDDEYKELLQQLLTYAQKGLYDTANEYRNIIFWVMYIDNPLKINVKDLIEKVLEGYKIHLTKTSIQNIRKEKYQLPNWINSVDNLDFIKNFLEYALLAIKEEETCRTQINNEEIGNVLAKESHDFIKLIFEEEKHTLLLSLIPVEELYNKITCMKNEEIINFNQLLERRYENNIELLVSEQGYLRDLSEFLETSTHKNWEDKPLKKRVINQIKGKIEKILNDNRFKLENYDSE